jgi:soluble lytic murein transglycosylase
MLKTNKKLLFLISFLVISATFLKISYPIKYRNIIKQYCEEYDLEPSLVLAIIKAESKFKPNAQSYKGAKGLMQITDSTAQWIADKLNKSSFKQSDIFDPKINIEFGCWYISWIKTFYDDSKNIYAAYNAGRTNVEKWLLDNRYSTDGKNLNVIPFKETSKYADKVTLNKHMYDILLFLWRL